MTERRKFLRFETTIHALCEIVNDKHLSASKVKNISKEGALVALDRRLNDGAELRLSMDVPGDNKPIFASCRVAWQKESNADSTYETGVRFIKIDGLDKGRLLEYIYLQWLKLVDK